MAYAILKKVGIQQDLTIKESSPNIPPWTLTNPMINLDMTKESKKSETAESIHNSKFAEIRSKLEGYKPIHTDGSNTEDPVAAAAVKMDKSITEAYNKNISTLYLYSRDESNRIFPK